VEHSPGGPEGVLFSLLEWQARTGLDQTNILILLCLVNLNVILGLVHRHLGGEAWSLPAVPAEGLPGASGPASAPGGGGMDGLLRMAQGLLKDVDPAALLTLAGPLLGAMGGSKGPSGPEAKP